MRWLFDFKQIEFGIKILILRRPVFLNVAKVAVFGSYRMQSRTLITFLVRRAFMSFNQVGDRLRQL